MAHSPTRDSPTHGTHCEEHEMNSAHASVVVRITAAVASIATTFALLSTVVSFTEPQRSELIAATAKRQMVNQRNVALVAKSDQSQADSAQAVATR